VAVGSMFSKDDSREERHSATVHPGHTAHGALHGHASATNMSTPHAHRVAYEGHAGRGVLVVRAGHSVAMFRDKFWIALLLTLPTLVWGHMLQDAFGYHAPMFSGARWIPPLFGSAVFFYGGWPFLQGAWRELRDRLPGMMTL